MSADAIARLRDQFEAELTTNSEAYHPIDIERVRTEDWQVKRFILDQKDEDEKKAFEALCKALQWKKSFGVHDRTDQYFPKEIWELNGVEINGTDKEGHPIQWERIRHQLVLKEATLLAKQFVAHCFERVDRVAGEKGFILVIDANGGGLSNVDMEITKFKIASIENYPLGIRGMYVVDLPWILSAVMKIIVSLMSDKLRTLVHYVKGGELSTLMDEQWIPVELKGKRDKCVYPENLIPMDQAKIGFDEDFIVKFYKTFKLPRTNA